MRASGLGWVDEFVARPARNEAPVAPARFVVACEPPRRRRAVQGLEAELEAANGKGFVGRFGDLGDGLAQAAPRQRGGAIMAVRIVAAAPFQNVGHPGAAALAEIPVIAGAAKATAAIAVAPHGAIGETRDGVLDGDGARVAGRVMGFRQRRAALDGAVSLEPQRRFAGGAAVPMGNLAGQRAPIRFVPAEIADAVAGRQAKTDIAALVIKFGQAIDDVDDLMRLQQNLAVVDGIAHRHRQLHLPIFGAGCDDLVEYLAQLRRRAGVDLGVDARLDADLADPAHRLDRLLVAAGNAAQAVVQLAKPVDRHADGADTGIIGGLNALLGQPAGAGLHAAMHAQTRNLGGDLEPIAPQIGLAADQGDFAGTGLGELVDDVETLGRRQLVGAPLSGARPAMAAFQIAGERDLPDHMDRHGMAPILRGTHTNRGRTSVAHGRLERHFFFFSLLSRALISLLSLASAPLRSPCAATTAVA